MGVCSVCVWHPVTLLLLLPLCARPSARGVPRLLLRVFGSWSPAGARRQADRVRSPVLPGLHVGQCVEEKPQLGANGDSLRTVPPLVRANRVRDVTSCHKQPALPRVNFTFICSIIRLFSNGIPYSHASHTCILKNWFLMFVMVRSYSVKKVLTSGL